MGSGNPSVAAGLEELSARGFGRIVVLPLYPQYAGSTTESTRDAVTRALRKARPAPAVTWIEKFHAHAAYVMAIAKNVNY